VNKYCSFIVGMGVVTVLANFLQHFYFGIMGEKMTERVRRMMFSGMPFAFSYMRSWQFHPCIDNGATPPL
jgi:hypothetical protein